MGYGWMGKVLWVDLENRRSEIEEVPEEVYRAFLSGYGLGVKMLYKAIPKGADPLGKENILGFCSGLLTGTGALFAGRYMACAKSPLTGGWGDANSGGFFSLAIKRAGYDAVFLKGISAEPVYIFINDERVEIREASHLWGKDTILTENLLKGEVGKKAQVVCIGPAGEKLSLISTISTDGGRMAARSGLGAVMGSKRVKGIAIIGNGTIPVKDSERVKRLSKEFRSRLEKGDFIAKIPFGGLVARSGYIQRRFFLTPKNPADLYRMILKRYGTCGITAFCALSGDSPVQNWKGTSFFDFPLEKVSKISDENIIKYEKKKYFCYSCPLGCGGHVEFPKGDGTKIEGHKPEYETLCSFGTLLLNDDPESIFVMNDLCNRAGIDTISAGSTLAFAIECFENGIIKSSDLDGLTLSWGDSASAVKLLMKVIERQGIGDILADGVKRAAEKLGGEAERYAMHCGGQEIPMHDPRFDPGWGTAYEVEPTPARHTIASQTYQELSNFHRLFPKMAGRIPLLVPMKERYRYTGKGFLQALNSKWMQVINGCGICIFGTHIGGDIPLFEWINSATGWDYSPEDYLCIGERILTSRHSFNIREGITPSMTRIPERVRGLPPLAKGPLKGVTLDMDRMVEEFYRELNWDTRTGIPDKERLRFLKLNDILETFYPEY